MAIWSRPATGTNVKQDIASGAVIDEPTGSDTGFTNDYFDYASQVNEIYRKWLGKSSWGNSQLQSLVNLLASFTCAQGATISSPDENFKYWVESFFRFNRSGQGSLLNIVANAHLSGKAVIRLKPKKYMNPSREGVFIQLFEYSERMKYYIVLQDNETKDIREGFYLIPQDEMIEATEEWEAMFRSFGVIDDVPLDTSSVPKEKLLDSVGNHLHYLRFGKDRLNKEVPDLGSILIECENYDRALKGLRKLNHFGANITPYWKCQNSNEVMKLKNELKASGWTVGKGFIGTAELSYVTAKNNTAQDALLKEMEQAAMRMTSQTGVPVHYLGFVQLMSNRSTADSLWDLVSTSTARYREALADFMYDVLVDAQQMYIDNSIDFIYMDKKTKKKVTAKLDNLVRDFEITFPVIDYQNFMNTVKGLSIAFNDGIIDSDEYRQQMPNVDPVKQGPSFDIFKKTEDLTKITKKDSPPEASNDQKPRELDVAVTPENLASKVNR